ncbi:MAG: hydrogenase iron-sulfur subunit [Candidatus Hydrogenedentota bacterium]|nr:MAG: hydrogenase iron-sulfur subunit [Candidatus Hydrogenedentota bacterium]
MEIWVFACQHRVPEDWRPPFAPEELMGQKVRLIQLPCSAKLSTVHMLRPFERGIDGILVMACSEKGCRSLEGSRRAKMRVREANNVLEEVGLGSSRVMLKQQDGRDRESYVDAIERLVAQKEQLGLDPVSGNNDK